MENMVDTLLNISKKFEKSNQKNNKKLKIGAKICTSLECNPKGYANCIDFDSCKKRTT